MQLIKRAFIYGFLLWLIPFVVFVIIFPLKKTDPAFFQSILGVVSIALAVILTVHYFQKVKGNLKEGIFLGLIFAVISWFFDFFFFIWGPIKMPLVAYIKEIGIGYLIYIIIPVGFGYLLGRNKPLSV
ncbi:MAG: hypothetical protein ABSE17_00400 [Candidatus Levyibacteriota bacterium]|jgi:hypothetical protein